MSRVVRTRRKQQDCLLRRVIQRRLGDIDQKESEIGDRALEVVADIRADCSCSDHGSDLRQWPVRSKEKRIGVTHRDVFRMQLAIVYRDRSGLRFTINLHRHVATDQQWWDNWTSPSTALSWIVET